MKRNTLTAILLLFYGFSTYAQTETINLDAHGEGLTLNNSADDAGTYINFIDHDGKRANIASFDNNYRTATYRNALQFFARHGKDIRFATSSDGGAGINKLTILNTGEIGIGTITPTEKFHVSGSGLVRSKVESSDNHAYYVVEGAAGKGSFVDYYRKGNGRIWHTGLRDGNNNFEFRSIDQSTVLALKQDGSIGVGTANTFGYKLAVNGTIGSTEVKVENTSAWPDFVFEENYELRSLEETEQFIAKNNHLPEIPSEADVTENGINLGEMDSKLLQKIEELTLYLIEQNKQLERANQNIAELQKKVSTLEND